MQRNCYARLTIQVSLCFGLLFSFSNTQAQERSPSQPHRPGYQSPSDVDSGAGMAERAYLVQQLTKIADPLLSALSQDQLKLKMPVESRPGHEQDRKNVTYLEAMGRLLAGMAPWLALGPDNTPEGQLRAKYIKLAVKSIDHATDPKAADFMNFTRHQQPLVDAAFLAQALLRAPHELWDRLTDTAKHNVIAAFKSSRVIKPGNNNWVFFSAMVEAAILKFTGDCDMARIDKAINLHLKWYKGDGVYGDGPVFHWDYYNSYVIQPMFLNVLDAVIASQKDNADTSRYQKMYPTILRRAQRYAAVQESLISPEGTYPPLGRSLAYRFGAFQLLSQIAYMQKLTSDISPQQVRAALYTVIKRQIEMPGTFDRNGWLQIGMVGHQPAIGEGYISTGSLYLCSEAFLILGLPPEDKLWQGKDKDWTAKKVWKGVDISIEHAIRH